MHTHYKEINNKITTSMTKFRDIQNFLRRCLNHAYVGTCVIESGRKFTWWAALTVKELK